MLLKQLTMKQFLLNSLIAIFSIFVGSQITEAVLLVPYWQSLSATEFFAYYSKYGASIGRFYTILTVISALIPVGLCFYCKSRNSKAFNFALISSFFAILFIAAFYIYFKSANNLFFQAELSETALKEELLLWNTWHWGRIILEIISLIFLMLSIGKIRR